QHGLRYRFRVDIRGVATDTADLWCTGATADSRWSVVLDPARTNPPGWAATPVPRLARSTDAVLYELHVRDLTIDPASGVPPAERGRYPGAVRRGAVRPDGKAAGIDHLLRLGITHVQVLPIQNFNPDHSRDYNWGYETTLFDVPEEQYSTRPEDPVAVVRDAKAMVQGFHRAGIGVVLDVVYNHTVPSSGPASPFEATVPWYWFRTDLEGRILNESGVGNALADDRSMARRWMLESLTYWVREFRVDGFRFDLMGMFTPETVRAIEATLRRIRPDLLLHGEPWTGGGPVRFGVGAQRGTRMAVFNDRFRGALRGDLDGDGRGFAAGAGDPAAVRDALAGSPSIAADPLESLNYVSAHDNLTLRDKFSRTAPDTVPGAEARMFRLSAAAVLLAQGIAFLEGGVEIGRTKAGNPNSYNAGDGVNRFDWTRAARFDDDAEWLSGMVALRRAHPAFRLATRSERDRNVSFPTEGLPDGVVAMRIREVPGEPWRDLLVVLNGRTVPAHWTLPAGRWRRVADGNRVGDTGLVGETADIPALGFVVLAVP
ncbi:MAG: pullulanase, partial [Armatimonadota bacterium]